LPRRRSKPFSCVASLLGQIFVYGDSLQSYLVAIAVPDADEVALWAASEGLPKSVKEVMASEPATAKLRAAIFSQMKAASKDAKLAGFEMVKKLHLDPEAWSVENAMLTPTFKLKRNDLKKRYQAAIDALYSEGIASAPATGSRL